MTKIFFRQLVEELLLNKKVAQAKHNILAYRVQCGKKIELNYDEDGENQSGTRLTYLLEKLDVHNVAVVVTRWYFFHFIRLSIKVIVLLFFYRYGGIHLGPDRFKHIANAAHQVLLEGDFLTR